MVVDEHKSCTAFIVELNTQVADLKKVAAEHEKCGPRIQELTTRADSAMAALKHLRETYNINETEVRIRLTAPIATLTTLALLITLKAHRNLRGPFIGQVHTVL